MFHTIKARKLAKLAKELVLKSGLLDFTPVSIRYNRKPTYRANTGDIIPYVAHTSKIVSYDNEGMKVKEEFESCSKISLCLGSIFHMAEVNGQSPEDFLEIIVRTIKCRMQRNTDPTWNGSTLHIVSNKSATQMRKIG